MSRDGFYGFVQSARRQLWRGNSSTCPPELQIAILPLLFDIWPLSVSNEERYPGICPFGIRNLPAWYQEFARFFFRDKLLDSCLSQFTDGLPNARWKKRQHLVHGSTTRLRKNRVGLMMKLRRISEKADLSQVRSFHHGADQGWCF